MKRGLQYAMEEVDTPLEIHVYPGADGEFTLYEDAGNDYTYENGEFATVRFAWNDEEGVLTVEDRLGSYDGMKDLINMEVYLKDKKITSLTYSGSGTEIKL